MAIYDPHICWSWPCPLCQRRDNPPPYGYPTYPTTTTTFSWPFVDQSPGKGRHRKGDPEAGA